jgi:hypothetical protein
MAEKWTIKGQSAQKVGDYTVLPDNTVEDPKGISGAQPSLRKEDPLVVPPRPSVVSFFEHGQAAIANAEVAKKVAYNILGTYAGIDLILNTHRRKPVPHFGHIREEVLPVATKPQTATDVYNFGMQDPQVSFVVVGSKGIRGNYSVDFFEFLTANLLYQESGDGIGVVMMRPSNIDGTSVDKEFGDVHAFQISKRHARKNVQNCARQLGLSPATLRLMVTNVTENTHPIGNAPELTPQNYPVMKDLLKATVMGIASA